ncbi:MAG TPA: TetR family transcriptional regulator [Gemmatimonadaceae bacterium]|jgi:TetR/AcrR family transcriptional regulator|nr:TetR family transcriptional regulator [Gemmatimonadaceae bacterium]
MVNQAIRKKPQRDTDTEARILDAAHVVFVRRGTAGARMQEIADEAGVNKALLHYYFRSKSRLAAAVFQRVARGLFLRVSEILGSDAAIDDKVRRVIQLYLEQLTKTPYAPAYVISELNQHPDRAAQFVEAVRQIRAQSLSTDVLDTLGKQLRRGVRAGSMRAISTPQFIANLASLCIFPFAARPMLCAILDLDDRGFARFIDERKTVLPEFFLNALRP